MLLWDNRGVHIAARDTNSGTVQYIFLRETTESRVADPCGVSELEQAQLQNMISVHQKDDPRYQIIFLPFKLDVKVHNRVVTPSDAQDLTSVHVVLPPNANTRGKRS